jgi:hypothetical protein
MEWQEVAAKYKQRQAEHAEQSAAGMQRHCPACDTDVPVSAWPWRGFRCLQCGPLARRGHRRAVEKWLAALDADAAWPCKNGCQRIQHASMFRPTHLYTCMACWRKQERARRQADPEASKALRKRERQRYRDKRIAYAREYNRRYYSEHKAAILAQQKEYKRSLRQRQRNAES